MAEVIKISKQHGRPEVGKLYQNSLDSGDFTYFDKLYDYIIEANYHYLSADNIYSEVWRSSDNKMYSKIEGKLDDLVRLSVCLVDSVSVRRS